MEKQIDRSKIMVRFAYHSDWEGAMKLAWDTFVRFNAPDYSKEGIKNFYNFIHDDMLRKMFVAGHYQLFVAVCDGEYLGMLSLREKKHISLLFVNGDYHGNGIGSALIKYVSKYVRDEEGINSLTVNASPYAVEFYHKRGFEDVHAQMAADGITFTPMELELKS